MLRQYFEKHKDDTRYKAVEDQNRIAAESREQDLDYLGFPPAAFEPAAKPPEPSQSAVRLRRERDNLQVQFWLAVLVIGLLIGTCIIQGCDIHNLHREITWLTTPATTEQVYQMHDTNEDQGKHEAPLKGQTTKGFSEAIR
jgi:hypothetical protein